jgi:hypothetical protein
MSLDPRSLEKLQGVHPDLAKVITEAANRTKFRITEGLRTRDRQKTLVAQRKSKTMNSRHLTGHAVDFVAIGEDGIATFDFPDMARVADVIKSTANDMNIRVDWGGDWKGAWDTPHFQLPWKTHPAIGVGTTTRIAEAASKPPAVAATGVAVGAGVVESGAALPVLPSPPDLSVVSAWQSFGDTISASFTWVSTNPIMTMICAAWVAVAWYAPTILRRLGWQP